MGIGPSTKEFPSSFPRSSPRWHPPIPEMTSCSNNSLHTRTDEEKHLEEPVPPYGRR